MNKGLNRIESCEVSFNREETETFLACRRDRSDPVWCEVAKKLEILGLTEDELVLSRNLRALIDRSAAPSP
jgi:hypothetical protein